MAQLSSKEKYDFEKFISEMQSLAIKYRDTCKAFDTAKKTIEKLRSENERLKNDYDKLQGRYNELVDKLISQVI